MNRDERLANARQIDRTRARAWVLQIHYRWESSGFEGSLTDSLEHTPATRRVSKQRLPYIRTLVMLIEDHLEEIDAYIGSTLDNWQLNRVSSVDRAILRIGTVEIIYLDRIPPKVSIQEAIYLAEAYGGSDSPRFVNGVLDAVFKSYTDCQPSPRD